MGDIKSTLDLVMERTRHLSLSAEEKEAQRRADVEKRLQGLLQQFADESRPAEDVMDRIAALQEEMQVTDPALPAEAVLRRVDPDGENGPLLDLLERLAPERCAALKTLLAEHRKHQTERLQAAGTTLQAMLARDHGITGSAVVPNPLKTAAVRHDLEALREETRSAVAALGEKKHKPHDG